jgi:hypothetical protein
VDFCLGYLYDATAQGHRIYDAEFGAMNVTPEQAKIHNQLLDKAIVEGLDTTCEIGQGNLVLSARRPDPNLARHNRRLVCRARGG